MATLRHFLFPLLELKGWRGVLLLLGMGGLSALTFPPLYFLPVLALTFPCLLYRVDRAASKKSAFAEGYWFGFGLHTVGLSWLVNAILIRANDFWWLVPIVSPLCAMLLGIWTGAATLLYAYIRPKTWRRIPVFAGLWTICDMTRAILLPSSWWNPILTGFPWNPLGSSWEWPGKLGDIWIQLAAVIGVDGLTLLTLLIVLTPLLGKKFIIPSGILLMGWAIFGLIRLGPNPIADPKTPIVVIEQGNIAEDEKIANNNPFMIFQTYLRLTGEGMQKAYQLREKQHEPNRPIVFAWPESAFPGDLASDELARKLLMQQASKATAGMIGAITWNAQNQIFNSVAILSPPDGQIVAKYNKSKLVPFGESQPALIPFHVVPGEALTPGEKVETFHIPDLTAFGALICYEVIFSGQIVDSRDRPKWLLNITNDAWYGDSAGPRQHLAAVRLRAVEEGIPIVRVANTGISAVYDSYGREQMRIGWNQQKVEAVSLSGPLSPTIFSYGGRWIPLLLSILCVLLTMI